MIGKELFTVHIGNLIYHSMIKLAPSNFAVLRCKTAVDVLLVSLASDMIFLNRKLRAFSCNFLHFIEVQKILYVIKGVVGLLSCWHFSQTFF